MSDSAFTTKLHRALQAAHRKAQRWVAARWRRLLERLELRPTPLRAECVAEVPLNVEPSRVYLVGEGGHLWQAVFKCPCGCEADVQLPLMPEGRPRWDATVHSDDTVSLRPSINRTVGCRSHFFIRHGQVEWAN